MGEPDDPPPRRPIPLLIWAGLGFVAVIVFAMVLRAMNPAGVGVTPPMPDIVVPGPKGASSP